MDCPWCGCGCLFSCSNCRKAFTFAEAVQINEYRAVTAERDIRGMYRREQPGEVEEWVEFMKILLKDIQCGEQYVYFDGYVIPVNADGITIEGWHSHHQLDFVPQSRGVSRLGDLRRFALLHRVLAGQSGRGARRLNARKRSQIIADLILAGERRWVAV